MMMSPSSAITRNSNNAFYLIAAVVIFLTVLMSSMTGKLSCSISSSQQIPLATRTAATASFSSPIATGDNDDDNNNNINKKEEVVFAMIAFGEAVHTEIVERAVESIRGTGNHPGYVLLITDAPQGHYGGPDDPNLLVYTAVMPKIPQQGEKGQKHMPLKMHYKRFKSRIIQIMDEFPQLDGVESIIYMDIDIVLGRDVHPFLHYTAESTRTILESPQFKKKPDPFLQLFPEMVHKNKMEDYHSGVMVMHRQYADGCLQAWQSLIDSEAFRRDQAALTQVSRHVELYNCTVHAMPREPFILFPEKQDMQQGYTKTFIHVTDYRAKKIPEQVQEDYFRDTVGVQHLAVKAVDAFRRR